MRFSSLVLLPLAASAFSPVQPQAQNVARGSAAPALLAEKDGSGSGSGSGELSARDARVRGPLTAASAALASSLLGGGAGPAAALSVPGISSDPPQNSAFVSSARQYFPASLPSSTVAKRAVSALKERGYRPENTLLASSLCSDEINDTRLSLYAALQDSLTKANSGGVFNLGGLGGVPFVGPSGFGAFFSHAPRDGKIAIVYGPHVGISADGVVGKVERVGMDKPSGACGAALGAYKAIKAERDKQLTEGLAGTELEGFPYETVQPDVQEDFIIRDLRKRMERDELDGPDQNALIALVTNRMYDMVSDILLREVDGAIRKPGFWDKITEVTLIGGLVINRGNPGGAGKLEDYFKPITFQSLRKAGGTNAVVTDNLLSYLYDNDPIAVPKPPSTDTLVGAGAATAAIAAAAAVASLTGGNDDAGGGGGDGGTPAPPLQAPATPTYYTADEVQPVQERQPTFQ